MSVIQVFRNEERAPQFKDGLSRQQALTGACTRIRTTLCTLQAGKTWSPDVYSFEEGIQIFLFINPSGYVALTTQAFQISEPSVFVPGYDREPFTVRAGAQDLKFIRIVGDMSKEDRTQIGKSHMIFPRFRPLSEAWEHTMRPILDPDSNTRAFVLIENRKLGCYNMGWLNGEGPAHVGEMREISYDQWCFALPGADYTYTADGESIKVKAGDMTFIPKNTTFSSRCEKGQAIRYVWFKLNRAYDTE